MQRRLLIFAGLALIMSLAVPVWGQRRLERLLDRIGKQTQEVDGAQAFAGTPFGVGKITIQLPAESKRDVPLTLRSASSRVFYPCYQMGAERPILSKIMPLMQRVEIYYLFTGNEPLDLVVEGGGQPPGPIIPLDNPGGHQQLLAAWWKAISHAGGASKAEYPPLIENYVTAKLSRRLGLPMPQLADPGSGQIASALSLLAGTEHSRIAVENQLLRQGLPQEPATIDLPAAGPAEQLPAVAIPDGLNLEPIAQHVPPECLYVRFGSFANFQWLRGRLDVWGGDLQNLVIERGLDLGGSQRVERQMGLKETALSKLFGGAVIEDVALIGTDTFVREGAAIGILFHAKNNLALSTDLDRQRREALAAIPGAKEETLEIEGQKVNFCGSEDHALRSFSVVVGDFHLVTTSRHLVQRFLQVAKTGHSLATLPEFQAARREAPPTPDTTAFIYLSTPFFENLLSPHYQVEISRRATALAMIDLWNLEHADRLRGESSLELTGPQVDGSRLIEQQGRPVDSLRGPRGQFVPVPDVAVTKITATEARNVQQLQSSLHEQWGTIDPVLAVVKRAPSQVAGCEKILIDVFAQPLGKKHFDMASQWLGPPSDQRLRPVTGNLVQWQVGLRGGNFLVPEGDCFFLGGLRNAVPSPPTGSLLQIVTQLAGLQGIQGYVGTWPNVGPLKWLGGASDLPSDANGFTQLRSGIWRMQGEGFTLLSLHPNVLAEVGPQLQFEPTPRPAQVWLRSDDLLNSNLAPLINREGHKHVQRIDSGNLALIRQLHEQLGVPTAECLAAAETLLDAKLVSPGGGSYQPPLDEQGSWQAQLTASGQEYVFPALQWFRGISAEVFLQPSRLWAHLELDMPLQVSSPTAPAATPPAAAAPLAPPVVPQAPPAAPQAPAPAE